MYSQGQYHVSQSYMSKRSVPDIASCRKLGDGLFLKTCQDISEEYKSSGIEFTNMIVDNGRCDTYGWWEDVVIQEYHMIASMQLVSRPQQFDVMVMPNLYGSILSNVGAGLVGGPGIIAGANFGREYAVFEPVRITTNKCLLYTWYLVYFKGCRHVGADIGGSNVANPTAMILSSVMLLRHLGLDEHANRISNAVYRTIQSGTVCFVYIAWAKGRCNDIHSCSIGQNTRYGW